MRTPTRVKSCLLELSNQIQELNKNIDEIKEVISCDATPEIKLKMISDIITNQKPHYFKEMSQPYQNCMLELRNAIIKTLNSMDRYVADELTICDTDKKLLLPNEVFIVDDVYEQIVEQLLFISPNTNILNGNNSTIEVDESKEKQK